MTDRDRLALVRERLTAAQLALWRLMATLAPQDADVEAEAEALSVAMEGLEAAVGSPVTPAALFQEEATL